MGCLKLTYKPTETPLNVVYRRHSHEGKSVQRFLSMDPLAEYAYTHSPYQYAYNNPIYFIDPDGMMPFALSSGSGLGLSDISNGDLGGHTNGGGGDGIYINSEGNKVGEDSKGASDGRVFMLLTVKLRGKLNKPQQMDRLSKPAS